MADKITAQQIRQMSDKEILDEIDDAIVETMTLRLQKASGELKNENLTRVTKRNIARLKTVLNERRLAAKMTGEGK